MDSVESCSRDSISPPSPAKCHPFLRYCTDDDLPDPSKKRNEYLNMKAELVKKVTFEEKVNFVAETREVAADIEYGAETARTAMEEYEVQGWKKLSLHFLDPSYSWDSDSFEDLFACIHARDLSDPCNQGKARMIRNFDVHLGEFLVACDEKSLLFLCKKKRVEIDALLLGTGDPHSRITEPENASVSSFSFFSSRGGGGGSGNYNGNNGGRHKGGEKGGVGLLGERHESERSRKRKDAERRADLFFRIVSSKTYSDLEGTLETFDPSWKYSKIFLSKKEGMRNFVEACAAGNNHGVLKRYLLGGDFELSGGSFVRTLPLANFSSREEGEKKLELDARQSSKFCDAFFLYVKHDLVSEDKRRESAVKSLMERVAKTGNVVAAYFFYSLFCGFADSDNLAKRVFAENLNGGRVPIKERARTAEIAAFPASVLFWTMLREGKLSLINYLRKGDVLAKCNNGLYSDPYLRESKKDRNDVSLIVQKIYKQETPFCRKFREVAVSLSKLFENFIAANADFLYKTISESPAGKKFAIDFCSVRGSVIGLEMEILGAGKGSANDTPSASVTSDATVYKKRKGIVGTVIRRSGGSGSKTDRKVARTTSSSSLRDPQVVSFSPVEEIAIANATKSEIPSPSGRNGNWEGTASRDSRRKSSSSSSSPLPRLVTKDRRKKGPSFRASQVFSQSYVEYGAPGEKGVVTEFSHFSALAISGGPLPPEWVDGDYGNPLMAAEGEGKGTGDSKKELYETVLRGDLDGLKSKARRRHRESLASDMFLTYLAFLGRNSDVLAWMDREGILMSCWYTFLLGEITTPEGETRSLVIEKRSDDREGETLATTTTTAAAAALEKRDPEEPISKRYVTAENEGRKAKLVSVKAEDDLPSCDSSVIAKECFRCDSIGIMRDICGVPDGNGLECPHEGLAPSLFGGMLLDLVKYGDFPIGFGQRDEYIDKRTKDVVVWMLCRIKANMIPLIGGRFLIEVVDAAKASNKHMTAKFIEDTFPKIFNKAL